MRKFIALGCALCLSLSCKPDQGRVDRISENGVDVVLNHLKPYVLRGEPSTLTLERVLYIDTEKDSTAAQGVTDIFSLEIDLAGNIYVLTPPTRPGNRVFKFSDKGELITSFGRMGQGPNELEYPHQILAVDPDKIWVLESPKNKYHVFQNDGAHAGENIVKPGFEEIIPLKNGGFLIIRLVTDDMKAKYLPLVLGLSDSKFQVIKELDRFNSRPNRLIAASLPEKIVCGTESVFLAKTSGGRIYAGNSERGYEILVYDLEGKLIRKIRKEYTPVPVAEEYKKNYMKPYEDYMPEYAKKIYFPENWHAFRSFFVDDDGCLFVMTYEPGENPGESVFDVFNKDGVFFMRTSLNILCLGRNTILARARGDRLYCVQEKTSGYKELVVYKMIWK
jgi:hypothetical protein